MWAELRAFFERHGDLLGWVAWGSLGLLMLSLLSLPVIAVLLPEDFLVRQAEAADPDAPDPTPSPWARRHPAMRWTLRILKNLAGALLAVAGLAMLVLPGQGLLTLAVALLMLDVPGKQRVIRRLLRGPRLHRMLSGVRRRCGRPPLLEPK